MPVGSPMAMSFAFLVAISLPLVWLVLAELMDAALAAGGCVLLLPDDSPTHLDWCLCLLSSAGDLVGVRIDAS